MKTLDAKTVHQWLTDEEELAFLDVREHGQYGVSHPLRAVWIPYSLLEARIGSLVPRLTTRIVLLDEGDGVAERAARCLARCGYREIHILAGGNPSWVAAGLEAYQGVNVPSKAFGEVVEHACSTPRIEPEELQSMLDRSQPLVIVDGRTAQEFERMAIPGGQSVPNAELVYRIADIAPEPTTTIVVNCAGRTRSIIGAQTLRNAGVENRVVALKGGTMAWRLAGFTLAHDSRATMPAVSERGLARATAMAERLRQRYQLPVVDADTVAAWQRDVQRTTYVFDVRTHEEFERGHFAGAVHAPGGQLVQATDEWCAVWRARVVLLDEGSGVRASTTAHWMRQMGWDVHVLMGAPTKLVQPPTTRAAIGLAAGVLEIDATTARAQHDAGKVQFLDVDDSGLYLKRHLPGAKWANRAQIPTLSTSLLGQQQLVVYCEHETRARLATFDLIEAGFTNVALLSGGREAWCNAGFVTKSDERALAREQRIDFLFWVHDRHLGNDDAAREYLRWEEALPAQLERSKEPPFPVVTG